MSKNALHMVSGQKGGKRASPAMRFWLSQLIARRLAGQAMSAGRQPKYWAQAFHSVRLCLTWLLVADAMTGRRGSAAHSASRAVSSSSSSP